VAIDFYGRLRRNKLDRLRDPLASARGAQPQAKSQAKSQAVSRSRRGAAKKKPDREGAARLKSSAGAGLPASPSRGESLLAKDRDLGGFKTRRIQLNEYEIACTGEQAARPLISHASIASLLAPNVVCSERPALRFRD
jgi:hypothetical protein